MTTQRGPSTLSTDGAVDADYTLGAGLEAGPRYRGGAAGPAGAGGDGLLHRALRLDAAAGGALGVLALAGALGAPLGVPLAAMWPLRLFLVAVEAVWMALSS